MYWTPDRTTVNKRLDFLNYKKQKNHSGALRFFLNPLIFLLDCHFRATTHSSRTSSSRPLRVIHLVLMKFLFMVDRWVGYVLYWERDDLWQEDESFVCSSQVIRAAVAINYIRSELWSLWRIRQNHYYCSPSHICLFFCPPLSSLFRTFLLRWHRTPKELGFWVRQCVTMSGRIDNK